MKRKVLIVCFCFFFFDVQTISFSCKHFRNFFGCEAPTLVVRIHMKYGLLGHKRASDESWPLKMVFVVVVVVVHFIIFDNVV